MVTVSFKVFPMQIFPPPQVVYSQVYPLRDPEINVLGRAEWILPPEQMPFSFFLNSDLDQAVSSFPRPTPFFCSPQHETPEL